MPAKATAEGTLKDALLKIADARNELDNDATDDAQRLASELTQAINILKAFDAASEPALLAELKAKTEHAYEAGIDEGRKEGEAAIAELRAKVEKEIAKAETFLAPNGFRDGGVVAYKYVLAEIDALAKK